MTHASVFSGIGCPEVAATMLGWDNLFHCEINPFGKRVLDYWYPNAKSYDDITTTDFSEWRGKVNVLTGGFPCQPFSYAGKRRGANDDRYLWPSMFRCIDEVQPTWVVAENVGGILTMVEQGEVIELENTPTLFDEDDSVHRYEYRGTFTLERICTDLEAHGYEVQPILIPACAVGAPHRRDRVFIVGHRKMDAPTTDSACSGEGTPRQSDCAEGSRSDADLQQNQRRESSEWSDRFYAILRHASDTDGNRQPSSDLSNRRARTEVDGWSESLSLDGSRRLGYDNGEVAGLGRWKDFPSQSPVHRGNDGIPFDVDSLTISFAKWRQEALKAYGNAIVPQVMYEIFRAIEQVQQQTLFQV